MFAIIYSTTTGRIRWHTDIGHASSDLDAMIKPAIGESYLKFQDNQYGDIFALQTLLTSQTTKVPVNDRYALIDASNNVVGSIIADTTGCGDSVPGMTMVPHGTAGPGWVYDLTDGLINLGKIALSKQGGTYIGAQSLSILLSNSNISIRYTTDGSIPTSTTGTLYTPPISIPASCILKLVAIYKGKVGSVVSVPFTIN